LFEKEFEARYGGAYQNPPQVNKTYKLIWLACGTGDVFLPGARKLSELLTQRTVRHMYQEKAGIHNFATFREQLVEFLPLLFR
jgi:enterochelin esterase-like enzyme